MRSTLLILLLLGCASFAAADDKTADDKTSEKKAAAPASGTQEAGIPPSAVKIAPYTFRYQDAKGKFWIYRQTPFGIARREDVPVSPEEAKKSQEARDRVIDAMSASEDGDSVHFTRSSPFGPTEWKRKKTDLNEIEQAVWNRELAKRANADSAPKD